MSILVDKNTRVVVQGMGKAGLFHAQQCRDYGTTVVGGISPGKGGTLKEGFPQFNSVYEAVQKTLNLTDEECAHMGDDILDLPLFERVGLAFAVADAHSSAKHAADWVASNRGGDGAIREAVDLILEAQGKSPF